MPAEISAPTVECPDPERWRMADGMAAEIEVQQFLYQLAITVKPRFVVETGTHRGLSAMAIARGLRQNGRGVLLTIERDIDCHMIARQSFAEADLEQWIRPVHGDSLTTDAIGEQAIDLLFCDSDPQIRVDEIKRFWRNLGPHSLILVHDVNTGPYRQEREHLLTLGLQTVFLPTPRGLAICQKKD